jgi:hypothetical protein
MVEFAFFERFLISALRADEASLETYQVFYAASGSE